MTKIISKGELYDIKMAGPYFHLLHNDYFTQTTILSRTTNPANISLPFRQPFHWVFSILFPSQCSSLHRMYTSLDEQGVMKPS